MERLHSGTHNPLLFPRSEFRQRATWHLPGEALSLINIMQTSSRQREIAEVLLRNGWTYMRQLLLGQKADCPQFPAPEVLRKILIELGPVYVKLGQVLSTRPDLLPERYIQVLSTLQSDVPPVNWTEIAVMLRQQLRYPLHEIFSRVSPHPIAAGSIAQVHRAMLADGREVALKVQRPGIERVVMQDIALIKAIAGLLATTDFGQRYDTVALAEEVAAALKAELDFCREANHCDQLRRNLSSSSWFDVNQILVPKIFWELTTEKLLVMEWLDGVSILSAKLMGIGYDDSPLAERKAITTLLFRVFFQQIFFDGFFHADPHPGNVMYIGKGRVALLDFGLMGRLDPKTQQLLVEISLAVINMDASRCSQLTLQLAESSETTDPEQLERDYSRLMGKYRNLDFSQISLSQLVFELMKIVRDRKLKMPGDMALYGKALANLEGVVQQFNPEVNLIEEARPLVNDLFRRRIVGEPSLPVAMTAALDMQQLMRRSPRHLQQLLEKVASGKMRWNFSLHELDPLRRSLDGSANRLSFSIVFAALILGAAIVAANAQLSSLLFTIASAVGAWLLLDIVRTTWFR